MSSVSTHTPTRVFVAPSCWIVFQVPRRAWGRKYSWMITRTSSWSFMTDVAMDFTIWENMWNSTSALKKPGYKKKVIYSIPRKENWDKGGWCPSYVSVVGLVQESESKSCTYDGPNFGTEGTHSETNSLHLKIDGSVGMLVSSWDGLFSGAMLVQGVYVSSPLHGDPWK